MKQFFFNFLKQQLAQLKDDGLYKKERLIESPQEAEITLANGQKVLNFCANNYLGLADHPQVIAAAKESYSSFGFGLASVRFICGTQTLHRQLEEKISNFLGTEDTILYSSCFDANGGLFEPLLGEEDAIISDELNHASIIDGIRLCKANRLRYGNQRMDQLEDRLKEAEKCRFKMIATDGVFSMDGTIANLVKICELADKYGAITMVDDCHAIGFLGKTGKGSSEYCNVLGKIDILTGTFGKALGGASGGYTSGKKEIISWLRQRSRPYLFSNSLAPSIAAATLKVFDLLETSHHLRQKLMENTFYFRKKMNSFNIIAGDHPIVPILLGDAQLAEQFASKMLEHGIYVIGFSYPVVPQGRARIRVQISAAHSQEQLDQTIDAFYAVGKELKVIQ